VLWFLLTWGIDILRSVFGVAKDDAAAGPPDMLRCGTWGLRWRLLLKECISVVDSGP